MAKQHKKIQKLRTQAEHLTTAYPTLLTQAERVAAIVAQGVHGRQQAGQGETFWQYRLYNPSDSAQHIDWRRSARSEKLYVRDNEWEAANTIYIWRDGSSGMNWRSQDNYSTKQDRANLLCMALALLLMRSGERCALMGQTQAPLSGQQGFERFCFQVCQYSGQTQLLQARIPAHAQLVIISDFLEPPELWTQRLVALSSRPAKGILLHITDPAERDFPYRGRMDMRSPDHQSPLSARILGRAEQVQTQYQHTFQAHIDTLTQIARRLDWPLIHHGTDKPATLPLTALYNVLTGVRL